MELARLLVRYSPSFSRHVLPYLVALKSYNSPSQRSYRENSEQALLKTELYSARVARDIDLLRLKFIADQLFLTYAKPTDLAAATPSTSDDDVTIAAIREQISRRQPFLFGCSYFGCMYFALLALKGLVSDLMVVTAGDPTSARPLFEKVAFASDIQMNIVGANENMAALKIMRQFKRGGSVATMLDCFYGADPFFYTDFLGKPAASPGALYSLAKKSGAIVVPTASLRRHGRNVLDIGGMIDLQSTSIEAASRQVNNYFSNLVRAYPGQWMGWQNLLARWSMAHCSCDHEY